MTAAIPSDASQDAALAPAKSKSAIVFIFVTVVLDMIGFGIIMPVLPLLIESVGQMPLAEAAKMGAWMFAAYALAAFAFGPFLGNLSDRFGRRPLLLLAVAGLGFDYLLHALAPTLGWLFVGRILAGLCGASWVIANAYITDVTQPEERGRYFGMLGAAFGLGFILGPAIGGLLGEYGARVPFYAAATISLLNFAFGYFILPESLPLENRRAFDWRRANPFAVFGVFATYKGVLPLVAVLALFFFATSVYQAIWSFWSIAKFNWSPAMVGLSLAAFGIVTAVFQGALSGLGARVFGEARLVLIGLCLGAAVLVGYGLVAAPWMVFALMVVHGPEGFVHPMITAILTRLAPEDAQGELQGGLSGIMSLSMLAGTVFFGQVFGYFMSGAAPMSSPDVGFWIAGGIVGAAALLFAWVMPHALRAKPRA
ncbi:MAG: MFS transporter [Cypionkella sp.]|nr:MFS transporter [Cypionkella sp.]